MQFKLTIALALAAVASATDLYEHHSRQHVRQGVDKAGEAVGEFEDAAADAGKAVYNGGEKVVATTVGAGLNAKDAAVNTAIDAKDGVAHGLHSAKEGAVNAKNYVSDGVANAAQHAEARGYEAKENIKANAAYARDGVYQAGENVKQGAVNAAHTARDGLYSAGEYIEESTPVQVAEDGANRVARKGWGLWGGFNKKLAEKSAEQAAKAEKNFEHRDAKVHEHDANIKANLKPIEEDVKEANAHAHQRAASLREQAAEKFNGAVDSAKDALAHASAKVQSVLETPEQNVTKVDGPIFYKYLNRTTVPFNETGIPASELLNVEGEKSPNSAVGLSLVAAAALVALQMLI